jgi:hypothetical protein
MSLSAYCFLASSTSLALYHGSGDRVLKIQDSPEDTTPGTQVFLKEHFWQSKFQHSKLLPEAVRSISGDSRLQRFLDLKFIRDAQHSFLEIQIATHFSPFQKSKGQTKSL